MGPTPPNRSREAALAVLLVCLLVGIPATGAPGAVAAGTPSNVSVTDATLERSTVAAGEEAIVDVTVTNDGDARESYAVELTGNGRAYVQTLVALDAGESRTVTFRQAFETPGAYDLAVNGVPAGTLTVTDGETAGPTAQTTAGAATGTAGTTLGATTEGGGTDVPLQAWFLLVLVVGALGAGGVYLVRGRRFR